MRCDLLGLNLCHRCPPAEVSKGQTTGQPTGNQAWSFHVRRRGDNIRRCAQKVKRASLGAVPLSFTEHLLKPEGAVATWGPRVGFYLEFQAGTTNRKTFGGNSISRSARRPHSLGSLSQGNLAILAQVLCGPMLLLSPPSHFSDWSGWGRPAPALPTPLAKHQL